ncbi:MAG: orotidine-5'-phosphate decarboxylase [Planctomycetes bacterium]|nr:orotidine-5'-phosphate decarboxylase [Planctomycetota bacterium]
MTTSFADRLTDLVAARGPVCAGVDPRPGALPAGLDAVAWAEEAARLLGPRVAAVKPQLAFFDDDWAQVERVARAARAGGALVVADCKRGDIDSTAEAYARRILGPESPFDAATVNPYLGRDALAPFVRWAARGGKGLFVLVRTSNPGAADLQSLRVVGDDGRPAETVAERVARLVDEVGASHHGASGRSLVGAVVGLTAPVDVVARLRALMPDAPFLMPGWGAQGGGVEAYRAALDARGGGALVSASRSLTLPWEGAAPADWQGRVVDALARMRTALG